MAKTFVFHGFGGSSQMWSHFFGIADKRRIPLPLRIQTVSLTNPNTWNLLKCQANFFGRIPPIVHYLSGGYGNISTSPKCIWILTPRGYVIHPYLEECQTRLPSLPVKKWRFSLVSWRIKMLSWEFKVPPPNATPKKPMVNSPWIRPYFLGG